MSLAEAAERFGVQPYYAAYMLAHGYAEIPKGHNLEFIFWIQGMWRESGLRSDNDAERFRSWLETRLDGPALASVPGSFQGGR